MSCPKEKVNLQMHSSQTKVIRSDIVIYFQEKLLTSWITFSKKVLKLGAIIIKLREYFVDNEFPRCKVKIDEIMTFYRVNFH